LDKLGHKFLSFFIKDAAPGAPGPVSAAPAGGSIGGKFAERLAGVLAKNNLPGPDYFKFRAALPPTSPPATC